MREPKQCSLPLVCPPSRANHFAPFAPGPLEGGLGANQEGLSQQGLALEQGQRKRLSIDSIAAAYRHGRKQPGRPLGRSFPEASRKRCQATVRGRATGPARVGSPEANDEQEA